MRAPAPYVIKASLVLAMALASVPWVAQAETGDDVPVRIGGEARLRSEWARSNGSVDAEALTFRLRGLAEWSASNRVSLLTEFEAVARTETDGGASLPVDPEHIIPDKDEIEINRLQVGLKLSDQVFFQAGRQIIALDDERFIGKSNFRQDQQTYDALIAGVTMGQIVLDLGTIWAVNRSVELPGLSGSQGSDSHFINISAPAPLGRIAAFHYDLDLETPPGQTVAAATSHTTGARWKGKFRANQTAFVAETAFAQQTERLPDDQSGESKYGLVAFGFEHDEIGATFRREVLGGGHSSFQTPLASLHSFQGAADVFVQTPAGGLKDTSLETVWRQGSWGPFRGISWTVRGHDFQSDSEQRSLGQELDFGLTALAGAFRISIEHAAFFGPGDVSDRTRTSISLEHSF